MLARSSYARIFLLLFSVLAKAQEPQNKAEYSLWSGGNFTNGHVFGFAQDRRLVPLGIVWAPVLLNRRMFNIRYRIEVIPAAFLHDQRFPSLAHPLASEMRWVYGAGVNPVGAQVDFGAPRRVRPFFEVTGGFLYFQSRILVNNGTRFNFTIAPGLGTHIAVSSRTAIIFGYKYHHMSNANISRSNPGVDSQELYLGVAVFR